MLRLFLGVQVIQIAEELVEAMNGGQKLVLVSQVVLAELAGGVAMILEQFGDRRIFLLKPDRGGRNTDLGEPGAERALAGEERRPAGGAALLGVIVGEDHPFPGNPINVRRTIAHQAHRVGTDVGLADVVTKDDQNVRLASRVAGLGPGLDGTRNAANRSSGAGQHKPQEGSQAKDRRRSPDGLLHDCFPPLSLKHASDLNSGGYSNTKKCERESSWQVAVPIRPVQ